MLMKEFSEAYSQVMYIMSNNQGKGVNEQELVYVKRLSAFVRR